VRALALGRDVLVFVSAIWQTTCTAVRSGEEGVLIDSPVLPEELEALPRVLEQSGFPVSGLLTTHGDWDHLLGRLAFAGASLGVGESTARRLSSHPGEAQRELRRFDDEHYVEGRGPLALGGLQSLPVPGRLELGDEELELHPAEGHTVDGTAYLVPWAEVLVCGDYLSPVEIPQVVDAGAYLETLNRLRELVGGVATVVAGHGQPIDREQALRVLDEDVRYVEALSAASAEVPLPPSRRTETQRRMHEQNVRRLTG
jgi:glyoxylase-like metal-dependent hydrolase (beta-lactamase superfamily II)